MNLEKMTNQLILHEGLKLKPYRCTAGKLTIGVGRNLDDVGITKNEALYLLQNDIGRAMITARAIFDRFDFFPETKQLVIVDMIFNLGGGRYQKFKQMIKAIKTQDWNRAAEEMKNSKWYNQVGIRAVKLYNMMRESNNNYTGYEKD